MFYGEYEHSIDRKGRLIIPAKFREVLKERYVERFFVTRGLDQCLFVFSEDEWRSQENRFKVLSFTREEARKFNRIYFSGAVSTVCDQQGRILVPNFLKEYAQIKRDVVIVGVSNRFEIWSRDVWKQYYEQSKGSFEEIAERLMDQGRAG